MDAQQQQFWWNLGVNVAVATATFGAVFVALFGEQSRAKFFPPRLKLELGHREGEKTELREVQTGAFVDHVRYYYLAVVNERRWSPAEEVQVYLSRIEEYGPNGTDLQVTWQGNIPIRWRNQEVVPLLRTIGPPADCDLCRIESHGGFFLMPLIPPNNLTTHRGGQFRLVASLQARSKHVDTGVMRVGMSWDGQWEDGNEEMKKHFVIEPLPPQQVV